jgi:hypothetical protein
MAWSPSTASISEHSPHAVRCRWSVSRASGSPRSKRTQRVLVVFAYTFPGARVILRPHFRVVEGGCRAALFFTERKQQTDGFLARDGVRTVTTSDFHGVFVLSAHTSELWAWAAKTFPLATFDYKERLESLLVEATPKCGTALRRDDPGYLFYCAVFGGDPLLVARFEPLREGRGRGFAVHSRERLHRIAFRGHTFGSALLPDKQQVRECAYQHHPTLVVLCTDGLRYEHAMERLELRAVLQLF